MDLTFAPADAAAIPLHVVAQDALDAFCDAQPDKVARWLRATGFTGALGSVVGLPHLARAQSPSIDEVLNDPVAPEQGNPEGDVTIVEYFDYQCPYCKAMHPLLRDVVEADGNVRLVMKDWPIFGPVSVYAAQAVQGAAALGDYETALDALMRANTRLSHEKVEEILTDAGLDFDAIAASVSKNQDAIGALLDRNYHQAEAFQFNGTPSFVIGRTVYPGVLDRALLEEAIAKARAA